MVLDLVGDGGLYMYEEGKVMLAGSGWVLKSSDSKVQKG